MAGDVEFMGQGVAGVWKTPSQGTFNDSFDDFFDDVGVFGLEPLDVGVGDRSFGGGCDCRNC